MRRSRAKKPNTRYHYDADRFPAPAGAATVRCSRGCGRRLVIALRAGETEASARRVCEFCAGARAARLAAGAEPADISCEFGRAVQTLAEQLGVAQGRDTLRRYPEVRS